MMYPAAPEGPLIRTGMRGMAAVAGCSSKWTRGRDTSANIILPFRTIHFMKPCRIRMARSGPAGCNPGVSCASIQKPKNGRNTCCLSHTPTTAGPGSTIPRIPSLSGMWITTGTWSGSSRSNRSEIDRRGGHIMGPHRDRVGGATKNFLAKFLALCGLAAVGLVLSGLVAAGPGQSQSARSQGNWSTKAPLLTQHLDAGVVALDGKMYLLGGEAI